MGRTRCLASESSVICIKRELIGRMVRQDPMNRRKLYLCLYAPFSIYYPHPSHALARNVAVGLDFVLQLSWLGRIPEGALATLGCNPTAG